MVLVCGAVSSWTWWSGHRGRNRRGGEQMVFAGVVIAPLRVIPGGRDIGDESLATQLLINRRLAHRADTIGAGLWGRHHRGVYRVWVNARLCVQAVGGCQRRGIRRIHPTNVNSQCLSSGDLTSHSCISL
ncbi:MAG: hypothetical protein QOH09_341 [Pseudonocardiales bacterium]|jgi:hypothetical protein|nr:hypothetical protein [Pseudonocardiales bacterium]